MFHPGPRLRAADRHCAASERLAAQRSACFRDGPDAGRSRAWRHSRSANACWKVPDRLIIPVGSQPNRSANACVGVFLHLQGAGDRTGGTTTQRSTTLRLKPGPGLPFRRGMSIGERPCFADGARERLAKRGPAWSTHARLAGRPPVSAASRSSFVPVPLPLDRNGGRGSPPFPSRQASPARVKGRQPRFRPAVDCIHSAIGVKTCRGGHRSSVIPSPPAGRRALPERPRQFLPSTGACWLGAYGFEAELRSPCSLQPVVARRSAPPSFCP